MTSLIVERITETAILPVRAREGDAGADIFADETVEIPAGCQVSIKTGLKIELPIGTYGALLGRSSYNKQRICMPGQGVIDWGYRGPITVVLQNDTSDNYTVQQGDKIAQLVVLPCFLPKIVEGTINPDTERGPNGFGSTGNNNVVADKRPKAGGKVRNTRKNEKKNPWEIKKDSRREPTSFKSCFRCKKNGLPDEIDNLIEHLRDVHKETFICSCGHETFSKISLVRHAKFDHKLSEDQVGFVKVEGETKMVLPSPVDPRM